jgi:hypothetical protein
MGMASELLNLPLPYLDPMMRGLLVLMFCFVSLNGWAADGEFPAADKMLLKWYQEHAAGKGVFLDEKRETEWDFVLEPELKVVLAKRNWGHDPLFFAQDAEVKGIKTKIVDETGGKALVLISFTNFGEPVRLVAHLNVTDHGWRLGNIVDPATGSDLLNGLDLGEAN